MQGPLAHELPFLRRSFVLSDPDDFGNAVSGGQLQADFLEGQVRPTQVEQFQSPAWALDFQDASVKARVRCPLPPGWATVGFIRSPVPTAWYGLPATQGALLCNPPGEPIDGWIAPGFRCLAVGIPLAAWEHGRLLAGVGEEHTFRGFRLHQVTPEVYASLENHATRLHELLRGCLVNPQLAARASYEAGVFVERITLLAWELAHPKVRLAESGSHRNRARLARRAEDWMRAHLTEDLHVPDLCQAMRVSRRELEYAFRLVFDESPRDYLLALRLNAMHRTLRLGGHRAGAITEVALRYAMPHLGRLSGRYRALFGENPVDTLRQGGRESG
jgi:AraC-like DNA-binding protein